MTETRNQIRALSLTERNFWLNSRTGKREHMVLKYLNFTEEQWAALNAPAEKKWQERLEEQQLIRDPDAVVAQAVKLLQSQRWDELVVVGLAVTTGRRLAEIL